VTVLVVDVGTSQVRSAIVDADCRVLHAHARATPPSTPFPGLVEIDGAAIARAVRETAESALAAHGAPVVAVGIAAQRASTLAWRRTSGEPIGPGLGWQDLRTLGACFELRERGLRFAPNQTGTKAAHLLASCAGEDDVVVGTIDTWVAWTLSRGSVFATDPTHAGVTGMVDIASPEGVRWSDTIRNGLGIAAHQVASIEATSGPIGLATALPGAPPIMAIVGDQQASLAGLRCFEPGMAKLTLGTGGFCDMVTGETPPPSAERAEHGTFPIVARRMDGRPAVYGSEAIMLAAGSNVEWLVDDLAVIATPAESHARAAAVGDTGDVWFVPALLGLGTPHWDYGARGTLLGVTRGTTTDHLCRAVLEGVAHRCADLLDAVRADHPTLRPDHVRIDGGMSANPTLVQAVADATGCTVDVSPEREATTVGAGILAGLAAGVWSDTDEVAASWRPAATVPPARESDRARWQEACERAQHWIPGLSSLDF
jgi:glycerol kinase